MSVKNECEEGLYKLFSETGKSELMFTLEGKNLTTQSIKDTQDMIDEHLGIRDGLLQRCCFFGQHSHTLHVR